MLRCSHSWLVSSVILVYFFYFLFFLHVSSPFHLVVTHLSFILLCSCPSLVHFVLTPLLFLPVLLPSSLSLRGLLRCNPGGISSGKSYSTSQYESGLQQRSQQGEQPGHQPRTLLHTAGWVAAADETPRRAYQNRSTLLFPDQTD